MRKTSLSRSVEDYLKAIYSFNSRGSAAGTSELARTLDVQPASVSGMVKKLAEEGMLEHERYHGVRLTPEGEREALKIVRRHRIIEAYLVERLGYAWEVVHDEAERLEHAASDALVDRMADALGNPTTDPHGAPIPNRDGEMDRTQHPTLDATSVGAQVRILSVSDRRPGDLQLLESAGIVPGAVAVVISRDDEGETLTVSASGGDAVDLPIRVASTIACEQDEASTP